MSVPRTLAVGGAAAGVSLAALVTAASPLIARWEGRRLDPYYDIAGVLTVCDGETLNVQRRRHTNAECDAMLAKAVRRHAAPVQACIPAETPLAPQIAYASLAYNVGVANFCGSSAARLARAGDIPGSCRAIRAWKKIRVPLAECPYAPRPGKPCYVTSRGLDRRRACEEAVCAQGVQALDAAICKP